MNLAREDAFLIKGWKTIFWGKSNWVNLALLSVAVLGLAFLAVMICQFTRYSLQMDFSAYYSAGASLNRGLSPYVNNYAANPPIWDGVSSYKTSRFLYFPLVGNFFQLFALLPYWLAKTIWALFNLAALVYALYCAARMVGGNPQKRGRLFLISVIGLCLFFPTYTYFERGQIDAITMLLMVKGIEHLIKDQPQKSGVFFALAMLIKINIIVLLPVFLISKYRKALPIMMLMAVIFCGLTLALNRWEVVKQYAISDFPRILKYNELGPKEEIIAESERIMVNNGYELSRPIIQGVGYDLQYLSFNGGSALSRLPWISTINERLTRSGMPLGNLVINAILYFLSAALCIWLIRTRKVLQRLDGEYLLWGLILTLILLISPLTWVMNLVWLGVLLPVIGIEFIQLDQSSTKQGFAKWIQFLGLIPGVVGWLFIALPEVWLLPPGSLVANGLVLFKNQIGLFLLLVWLAVSINLKNLKLDHPERHIPSILKENTL